MRLARIIGAIVARDPYRQRRSGAHLARRRHGQAQALDQGTQMVARSATPTSSTSWGKVATFPKGRIKVLRNVAGGKYTAFKKTRTKSSGKFRTPIAQVGNKKTCFKVQVPATSVYRKTTSRSQRLHHQPLTSSTQDGPAPAGVGPSTYGHNGCCRARGCAG